MDQKDIISLLRDEKRILREKFGLISIGLFGSHAKGTEGPESDIDLLVELVEPRFDSLAGFKYTWKGNWKSPLNWLERERG